MMLKTHLTVKGLNLNFFLFLLHLLIFCYYFCERVTKKKKNKKKLIKELLEKYQKSI